MAEGGVVSKPFSTLIDAALVCRICAGIHRPGDPCTESKPTNPKDLVGIKKLRMSLIPPAAKAHLAAAMQNGAEKYGAYNWREKGVRASIYLDAIDRHWNAWMDGEELAADSGVHHLGHLMACAAILLDSIELGNFVDDRPLPGPFLKVLERYRKKDA